MTYYIITSSELTHYGVKGMKWGVRHDRESTGRKRIGRIDNKNSNRIKLSKGQKIALGIAAATAIAGVSYLAYKSGKFDKLIAVGKKSLHKNTLDSTNSKLLSIISDKQDTINSMNPNNDQWNCAFTSSGYIVNKLTGKTVTAKSFNIDLIPGRTVESGTLPDFFNDVFDNVWRVNTNPKAQFYRQVPSLKDTCNRLPDNSYGILKIHNALGFGHYVNYEKVDGAMRIIDCQSNIATGSNIDTVSNWAKKGWRATEIFDCTNAAIKNEDILRKVLNY